MNRKDLDALNELYLSVYDGEQLNEAPGGKARFWDSNMGRFVTRVSNTAKSFGDYLAPPASASANPSVRAAAARETQATKPERQGPIVPKRIANAPKPTELPRASAPSAAQRSTGASTTPARPAASGPVLSKKNGVEGTGVGANFKARPFSAAEKSRYSSVAAKNSASSGAAKPAIGKLGNTSFERRTPTSAELRAAQTARAGGASPEKALQAAQKTNLPTQGPTPAIPSASSVAADVAKANSPAVINRPAPAGTALAKQQEQQKKPPTPGTGATMQKQSYEWPSAKTIKDIADLYSSIYEAKKRDQDKDGDNDFADVRIARMIASGMSKAEAIAAVRNKEYNEEFELDEATRMRKELGKEGETATRKELAARSKAFKRSGSVDKTIAAAEAGADRPYIKHKRDESEGDRKKREQKQSRTLTQLASSRRKSVRDGGGLRGYAAKVTGSDKDLQSARSSARSAGTLTPKEKKQIGEEYAVYEIVASYLLENNFAETINDANAIIQNMSENWFSQILESFE